MNQALITTIEKQALETLSAIKDKETLARFEVQFLGRKSELSRLLKDVKNFTPEQKRTLAPKLQALRQKLTTELTLKQVEIENNARDWEGERLDVTAPGKPRVVGHLHPITLLENEVVAIFETLGFLVADGP